MDYHQKQLPLYCRVWAKAGKEGEKKECKAYAVDLHITSTPLLITLKCTLNIFATAVTNQCKGLSVPGQEECTFALALFAWALFAWAVHTDEGCKVCEHFNVSAKGHARKHTVGRGHQPGLTPNKLTAHLLEIATPPVFSHESYPPLASQNNVTVLNELKCVVCSNILLWPLELPCRKLVCTRCVMEQVAASTTVCSCYSKDGSLVPREIGPASNVTLMLLKDILVQCMPMTFMYLTKAQQLTTAACSRTVNTRCAKMQTVRSIISGGESSALTENEVLTLSDEE
ncbi:hypothetical protein EMCRGX_G019554 [Ephydatia muelleri]